MCVAPVNQQFEAHQFLPFWLLMISKRQLATEQPNPCLSTQSKTHKTVIDCLEYKENQSEKTMQLTGNS